MLDVGVLHTLRKVIVVGEFYIELKNNVECKIQKFIFMDIDAHLFQAINLLSQNDQNLHRSFETFRLLLIFLLSRTIFVRFMCFFIKYLFYESCSVMHSIITNCIVSIVFSLLF